MEAKVRFESGCERDVEQILIIRLRCDKMPLVSIIVPVYNSEKYVERAVSSILNQSEKDIQVILVNDGSEDASCKVCDKIASMDNRVMVIHQENRGISAARNTGLKFAVGEYIGFCDNDDEYLENLVEDNYALAKKYDADIVRYCRRRIVTKDGRIIRDSVMDEFPFLVIEKSQFPEYESEITNTGNGIWTGLYKRSFIQAYQIQFDEFIRYGHEDTMFNLKAYQSFHTMVLNPKVYYVWKNRMEHSTTGKFNMNYIESMKKCLNEEIKLAKIYGLISCQNGKYHSRLAKTYIYSIYDYLILAKDKLKWREKRAVLKRFRQHNAFKLRNNYQSIKKEGLFFIVLWTMFYYKLYMVPYAAIKLKQKIINN